MIGAGWVALLRFETEFVGDGAGGGTGDDELILDGLPSSCFTGETATSLGTVSGDFWLLFSSPSLLGTGLVSVFMILLYFCANGIEFDYCGF